MSPDIRICFVVFRFYPLFSGRAIFIQKLVPKLQQRGIEVCVLAARLNDLPKYECIHGVHVYRVSVLNYGTVVRSISFVFSCLGYLLLKGKRFNIIQSCKAIWFASGLFKFLGRKTIFDMTRLESDDPEAVMTKYGPLALKLYSFADHITSPSTAMSTSYHNTHLPDWKLSQIPRGIDPDIFQPVEPKQKQILRRKLGLPQKGKIVVCVGAITKRKGTDFLIDVWAEICPQYQEDTHLLLIGPFSEPEFLAEVQQKIQQYQIQERVSFVGEVDNVREYLGASEIFVFCSDSEGLPNALIEAASCGLPCVVLRIDGITDDIITHGVDGIIVENREVNEYAEALLAVLRKDALAHQLGSHARRKVLEKFSIDAICDQYVELYQKLLS